LKEGKGQIKIKGGIGQQRKTHTGLLERARNGVLYRYYFARGRNERTQIRNKKMAPNAGWRDTSSLPWETLAEKVLNLREKIAGPG